LTQFRLWRKIIAWLGNGLTAKRTGANMENGTPVTIDGKTYEIGTRKNIGGLDFEVYNTMPGLQLIGFAKIGKNGKRTSKTASYSFEQIQRYTKIGSIR
jgi:hypothetical protein